MLARSGGRVVNVSSRGAFRGEPNHLAYGASKAALNAFGQSLARALAPHGIAVTTVAPGYVDTDMAAAVLAGPDGDEIRAQSPFSRVATPEEVASAVLFLASPEAEFASGTILDIKGWRRSDRRAATSPATDLSAGRPGRSRNRIVFIVKYGGNLEQA